MHAWIVALVLLAVAAPARAQDLGPGARAPDFALAGSDGRQHRLSDFAGKRGVVLAWFPKAFTSG